MAKSAVIHQPDFLSYLGFFHRLLHSDLYIALDCVQIKRGNRWENRDKIKTPNGEKWISVAVQKTSTATLIGQVLLSDAVDWRKDHLNLFREHYRNAAFFSEVFPYLEFLYSFKCDRLMDFNMESIKMLMGMFGIKRDIVLASSMSPCGKSNELLVDILIKAGCDTYLSGVGAKGYHLQEPYDTAGIKVVWQDFKHPVYPQLHGEFIPYLSSIDLLFNCGIGESRRILRSI